MTDPETLYDAHHEGTSDAAPGGYEKQHRPGEVLFAIFLTLTAAALLWSAHGISGFSALSSPGSVPMVTTAVLLGAGLIILLRSIRRPMVETETPARAILPGTVILMALMLVAYGVLLRPLGFLPTSALFLIAATKVLSGRSWAYTLTVALGSLVLIWLIFRIVFTVLMPPGFVPEAEFIQIFRTLFDEEV